MDLCEIDRPAALASTPLRFAFGAGGVGAAMVEAALCFTAVTLH